MSIIKDASLATQSLNGSTEPITVTPAADTGSTTNVSQVRTSGPVNGPDVDLEEARQFLRALGKTKESSRMRFIPPKDDPAKGRVIKTMCDRNTALKYYRQGYGVYAVIGSGGDSDADITAVPAFFVDDDNGRSLEELKRAIAEAGLPPASFINFSGKRGHHAYWVLKEPITDKELFRKIQKGLIAALGTDPTICNPSRVMRFPGHRHVTHENGFGEMCRRVDATQVDGELVRYSVEDIESVLPSVEEAEHHERAKKADEQHQAEKQKEGWAPRSRDEIEEALQCYPPRVPNHNTYHKDRNMGWGLVAALMEAEGYSRKDAIVDAIALLKVHSPEWENVEQVIRSGDGSIGAGSFWYHAQFHGYKLKPTNRPGDSEAIPENVFPVPGGEITYTMSAERIFSVIGDEEQKRLFSRDGRVTEFDNGKLDFETPERFVSLIEGYGYRVAKLERVPETKNGETVHRPVWRNTTFPVCHAKILLESDATRDHLPQLAQLSDCPVLTRGGEVLGRGWHSFAGGTYVTSNLEVLPVPLEEATRALLGLLIDFGFASESDRSRAVASILSPALKAGGWITDDFPLDFAEADKSQSGKTYRQRLVVAIYGAIPAGITMRKWGVGSLDEDISAALIAGKPFIILDNIRGAIDSQIIESAIRGHGRVKCRTLRKSGEVETRPFNWYLTTNGALPTLDLANRSVITRIRKRPPGYSFKTWPEGRVLEHVKANQAYYLGCVFSILLAWKATGCKKTGEMRHTFQEWTQSLDYIVQHVMGLAPLMDGHEEEQLRISNPNLQWLRSVCLAVCAQCSKWKLTAAQLGELVEDHGIAWPTQARDEPHIRVGRIMGAIFRDAEKDVVRVDDFTVTKLEEKSDPGAGFQSWDQKFYEFSDGY